MHRRYEHINIPIEIIRTLIAVAECGSYSKAGAKLALSQPAISAQIKRIQMMVGAEIFGRSPSGIEITERGALVITHARKILEANDQILALGGGAGAQQPIRVGLCALFAADFFKNSAIQPQRQMNIVCTYSSELGQKFADGYLDVACILNPSADIGKPIGGWFEDFVWARDRQFVMSPGTPIPIVTWPNKRQQQPAVDALERSGLSYRIAFTSIDLASRIAAVSKGLGIMAMPSRQLIEPLVTAKDYYLPKLAPIRVGICVRPGLTEDETAPIVDFLMQLAPRKQQCDKEQELDASDHKALALTNHHEQMGHTAI